MNSIRQKKICDFIESNQIVTIKQLQNLYPDVSLMTIHRDLDALVQNGKIVKVRGGARAVRHTGDPGFEVRLQENNAGKMTVAAKALTLIQPGSTIFLDASTTNLMLARALPDIHMNIFTTAPNITLELSRLQNPSITQCCGNLNRKTMSLSGQNTLDMLERINIDIAFVGVSGCSVDAGLTCGTEGDMAVKAMVLRKARKKVIMCDKEKFSRLMPYTFARLNDIDYLISDGDVPEAIVHEAKTNNVIIL